MIILHEVAEQTKDDKFNGLTLRHPQAAYTRSTSPSLLLPDYDTSEAQHREVANPPSSKFKLDAKTWKTALYALAIYIFLTLSIAVPVIVVKSKTDNYQATGYPPSLPVWADDSAPPPLPYRMDVAGTPPPEQKTSCNNWQTGSNSPNFVISSFQLPPTGCITIRSNATYNSVTPEQLNGTLSVSMNTSNESSILFTVEMQSSNKLIRDQTNVCFNEEGIDRGLSIYVPSNIGDGNLTFNINVILPRVHSNVDNFATYLPMFSQTYEDLRHYLNFSQFTLEGSSRPIYCQSLQASQISVTNILAPIQGSFNVTDLLCLDSIRGPIIADITLSPRSVQTRPTTLRLGTGESAINASITLNAQTTTSIPSSFPVFVSQVRNFNGPVQLDVAHDKASLPSPLQLHVENNAGQSTINMDSRFQGCFHLQTKISGSYVNDTVDSQKNSLRILDFDTKTTDKAIGWVGWNRRPVSIAVACRSYVDVLSGLGPVNLTFGL